MRVKITFSKSREKKDEGEVPVQHQRLLCDIIKDLTEGAAPEKNSVCFSSLKGTTRVAQDYIRFLGVKATWTVSSPHEELINMLLQKLFERKTIDVHSLSLSPKSYELIGEPKFATQMDYLCLSPYVPYYQKGTELSEAANPDTNEFSDKAFEYQILRMEHAGYSEEMLNAFSEFEIIPDPEYLKQIVNTSKGMPRLYLNPYGERVFGYIFPFAVHAHPELQKFVWENGIGQYTDCGYGMLDTVPPAPVISDVIIP